MKRVDVAIIGGSLAGAACARELTRLGVESVAFERDRVPQEKVCGSFLSPGAVGILEELGMLGAVREAGATTVRSAKIRMGHREIGVELAQPGLGISRRVLDGIMRDHPAIQLAAVREVEAAEAGFTIQLDRETVTARVVVDAAGKRSPFTKRRTVPQFGVQFYDASARGDVLDFWFFEGGYGGAVNVEGGRANACFLINKDALRDWMERKDGSKCLVTGPIAYDRLRSDFLAIGDAAGMIDPFCGEGMRHALDTGVHAARTIADGLGRRESYASMKARYEHESGKRWQTKRRLGRFIRSMLPHSALTAIGFRLKPEFWFRKLWE